MRGYLAAPLAAIQPQASATGRKGGQAVSSDARNIGHTRDSDPNYMTPSERMFGESLMHVPMRDLAATKSYLGHLAGGAFIKGVDQGAGAQALKEGPLRQAAGGDPSVAPMAAAEKKLAKPVTSAPSGKVPHVIKLPAGTVGIAEDGQAVDRKGKKLGYLQHQNGEGAALLPVAPPRASTSVDPNNETRTKIRI